MLAGQWQNYRSERVDGARAQSLGRDWSQLAAGALQPAGYNAPELILPLMQQMPGATLHTVRHGPDMLFAVPLVENWAIAQTWDTSLTASGVPHVSAELAQSAVQAFVTSLSKPVFLKAIPTDGAFAAVLKKQSSHYEVVEQWQRAALKPAGTFEEWMQNNFDQKRRKEFKRLRNRLAEQGNLQLHILHVDEDPQSYIDELLALEVTGWKGERGTAIATDQRTTAALIKALHGLHRQNKLRFWCLKLDNKPIAALYAIVEGDQAWLGKIAYDERYSKYSPGVQVILDCTEGFFEEPSIKCIDSSAIPNHPMIDRIWRDRIQMISVMVAPSTISKLRFDVTVKWVRQRVMWRERAKSIYYRLKGLKRS
jgi:CelD/BcsL family acetyltransferase involved in cellulose biosynthesis